VYQFAVCFDVRPEDRERFIDAARELASDSLANEPGTLRFDLIADESDRHRFYVYEAYDDVEAFNAHSEGDVFQSFQAATEDMSLTPTWLFRGHSIGL
jgi:autoinducer 2-degrading protein